MSRELLISGQLYGKIAGLSRNKDWVLFYLEVSSTQLHIFEGHDDLTTARKHLRSLEIDMSDMVVAERDKKIFKFTLKRADGNYTFKCDSGEMRQKWTAAINSLINKRRPVPGFNAPTANAFDPSHVGRKSDEPIRVDVPQVPGNRAFTTPGRHKQSAVDHPLPPVPGSGDSSSSPGSSGSGSFSVNRDAQRFSKMSVKSDDSGLGPSVEGHVRHSHSGDGTAHHRVPLKTTNQTSVSDSAKFDVREELENYPWFWGHMDRQTSEKKMKEVGKVGNFSIRINAKGEYVMTFWRNDGVHHHRIIHQCGIYRFERTAVSAEGASLVDLLDNYMKNCTDKKIVPFGGQLHLVYDEAWNPPEIDMEVLQEKLREKRRREDRQRLMDSMNLVQPQHHKKKREKKEEYTVVSGTSDSREEFSQSMPASGFLQEKERLTKFHVQPAPHEKRNGLLSSSKQASEPELGVSHKPLPPTPLAKPQGSGTKHKPLPVPPTKPKPSPSHSPQPQRVEMDKRHNPLPPVPDTLPSSDQPVSDGGRSPRAKKGPVPAPAPRKHLNKSPTSPTPIMQEQRSPSPASHSPPQEQSIYMNTNFARSRVKKSPAPKPRSPSLSPPLPTEVESGPLSYQNVGFGDSGGDGALYANIAGPRVNARKGTGEKTGRARAGKRDRSAEIHTQQQQVDSSVHQASSYQNVAFNGQSSAGTEYQNVNFTHRGNTRSTGPR